MTIKTKLWSVLGLLIGLLVLSSVLSFFLTNRINREIQDVIQVEEAVLEWEIAIVEASIAVLKYIDQGDPDQKKRLADSISEFGQIQEQFERLVTSDEKAITGREVVRLFQEFVLISDRIIEISDEQRSSLALLTESVRSVDGIIGEELTPLIEQDPLQGVPKLEAILSMEVKIHEAFSAVQSYVISPAASLRDEVSSDQRDYARAEGSYTSLVLSGAERSVIAQIRVLFDETVRLSTIVLNSEDEIVELENRLSASLEAIDGLIDDEIQPLIQASLTAAEKDVSTSISIATYSNGVLLIIGLSVSVVGLLVVTRQIITPLGELGVAARLLGEGVSSARADIETSDEIGDVATAFNEMAAAHEVNENRMQAAIGDLEDSNSQLESFSYSVSHDLRSPLRAIDGFSRLLLEDHSASLDPEAQRYLGIVRRNSQQMGLLIDDLLQFSRLGREPVHLSMVSPATLARESVAGLRGQQEGREVEISIGEMPDCRADPSLLKQVYDNLISNALKFTRDRNLALIEIGSMVVASGEPAYFVRDNGVGFDMAYADKLFGVFQRLHRPEDYEGTGVGLAIVERVIQKHGGRVWAESELDKETTFYFTLKGEDSIDYERS